jgi:hypothetical protein
MTIGIRWVETRRDGRDICFSLHIAEEFDGRRRHFECNQGAAYLRTPFSRPNITPSSLALSARPDG